MPVIRKIRLNDRFFPPDSRSSDLLPIYIFLTTFLNIFYCLGVMGLGIEGLRTEEIFRFIIFPLQEVHFVN